MGIAESLPELDATSSRQLLNSLHHINGDAAQPGFYRRVHRRYPPSSLRQIRRIANPICVLRDSLEILKEEERYYLQFSAISKCEGSVIVIRLRSINPDQEKEEVEIVEGSAQVYRVQTGLSEEDVQLCVSNPSPAYLLETIPKSDPSIRQITTVAIEKGDSGLKAKAITQRVKAEETEYMTYEIFGTGKRKSEDCVVCLTQRRDTAVMPCRHLCLCASCAEIFRRQTSCKCPMCRASKQ